MKPFTFTLLTLIVFVTISNVFSTEITTYDIKSYTDEKNKIEIATSTAALEVTTRSTLKGPKSALSTILGLSRLGTLFCELYQYVAKRGTGPKRIKQYIEEKFPKEWHNHLIGKLFYDGLFSIIDISAKLCNVKDEDAKKYLMKAKLLQPFYDIDFDDDLCFKA